MKTTISKIGPSGWDQQQTTEKLHKSEEKIVK
jgi:hypothetical protein